ncbi:SusC/RagA family TonB-linked outer membrane protein [Bacteroidia bacterium]|nr:SusC/RagA family TonB-linked outer membrane protein [Bacteroidia bacterium]
MKHTMMIWMLGFLTVLPAAAQNKQVNGQVFDNDNEPVIGATILVPRTNDGVITDLDGKFSIHATPQDKIEVRYLGFVTQTIPAGSQTFLTITLQPETNEIDEVVIVGYGTQKKINVTGAVASIDYSKQAMSRPIVSAPSALAGMIPGVSVLQGSGQPGNEEIVTRIRGYGTLNSTAPLIIVDGNESSITAVSPDDIETITILKDAAACAIYGSHAAANGVVLITTKQGQKGKNTVSYSGMLSYNAPSNLYKEVSDYADYMEFMNESAYNVNASPTFTQEMIDLWREKKNDPNGISESGYPNYVAYPNIDWMAALFRNSWLQKHSLSVSGASEKTSYLFSAVYTHNPGVIEGTDSKKYQIRANITSQVKDWLQVGTRIWGYNQDMGRNQLDNIFSYISRSCPGMYPYYDGKYGHLENPEQNETARNNLFFLNRTGGYYKSFFATADLFSKITFKDFTYNTSFVYQRYFGQNKFNVNSIPAWSFRTNEITYPGYQLENLKVQMDYSGNYKWIFSNNLRYDKKLEKHDISAMIGYESGYQHWDNTSASKIGLPDDAITELVSATKMDAISGTQSDEAYQSIFGRATYAFNSRYLVEMNMRYDASSKFGTKMRWGFFPSFSAGWRVTEEAFMKNVPIDNLKIRISYGTLGNNTCGSYDYQATYDTKSLNYPFGSSLSSAIAQTAIANEVLHWETTRSTNLGIDLGILKNRLSAEIDIYNRETSDVLNKAPIYSTMGEKSPPTQNIFGVRNLGYEISLKWQDKINDFQYSIAANGSRNYNEISKYKGKLVEGYITNPDGSKTWQTNIGDVSIPVGAERRQMEGKIINEFYLLNIYSGNGTYFNGDGSVNIHGGPKDGMIRTEQDMQWLQAMAAAGYSFHPTYTIGSPTYKSGLYYGDYIYADTNNDGIYGNDYDKTFQNKSLMPKIFYGFQINAAWKGFDFAMNWMGAAGGAIYWRYLGLNSFETRDGFSLPYDIAYDHYFYDPENPNDPRTNLTSKNARLAKNYDTSQQRLPSTLYLYSSDFLKLKNLTFGYTLPKRLIKKIGLSDVRLYVSGENLWTITGFPGMDPEMQTATGYVTMKQFTFGLNVNF